MSTNRRPHLAAILAAVLTSMAHGARSRILAALACGLVGCGPGQPQVDPDTGDAGSSPPTADTPTTTAASTTTGVSTTTAATTSSGGSTTTVDTVDPVCGDTPIAVALVRSNVLFVIDKSSSMVADPDGLWDHDGDDSDDNGVQDADPGAMATPKVTRWRSLHEVVAAVATSVDTAVNLGALLFPSLAGKPDFGQGACPVSAAPEVEVGPMHAAAILAAIPPADATDIGGATPTTKAVQAAVAALAGLQDGLAGHLVLITDGAANCSADAPDASLFEIYDDDLLPAVADAFTAGITTHVVGIAIPDMISPAVSDGVPDGVNPHAKLDELAFAGGAPLADEPRFHDTHDQLELQAAVVDVLAAITCTIRLDPMYPYWDYVDIEVAGVDQPLTDCSTADGWTFSSDEHDEIRLCSQACADFQKTGTLYVRYRCPTTG